MADRFPSLDDFDPANPTPGTASAQADADAPSDFLARERAALGDDAAQFASSTDATAATVADADDDDDLLGGGGNYASQGASGGDVMGDFESSFPSVDTTNEAVAPGGTITGSTLPYRAPEASSYNQYEEEPQVLQEWRARRDLQIQHRDEVSAGKKAETVKAAQEAIDEFYENYNNRKDKQIAQTRKDAEEFLKNREDTTSGGTSWERSSKLIDLSGKGTAGGAAGSGKSKMREMLLSLRKDEKAPGATGY